MHRKLLVGAVAAALAPMAISTSSTAGTSTNELTISPQPGSFSGFVLTTRDSCHNGRKVTLYRRKAGVRKPNYKRDKKIGSDIATPNQDGSQWKIDVTKRGKYYAHVKKKGSCKAMYSKVRVALPIPEEEQEG